MQDILDKFDFRRQIAHLQSSNLLWLLLNAFKSVNLDPNLIDNHDMGIVFEELIRRFAEQYNETAGEHFTPREVIRLMVDLLLSENPEQFAAPGKIIEIYDPAAGTGGMLTEAETKVDTYDPAEIYLFGQELNPTAYATAKADLLLKGRDPSRFVYGNSFSEDGHSNSRFRLMLSNPPYGVEWKKVEYIIRSEYESKGFDGRFGAGLPRITDGSLLFLQHMLSKRMEDETGSRIGVVFNGSPLFTGDAGGGESEIRRWIIESDWLEGVIALPDQLFYNTGISTYIWIVTNRKSTRRRNKVQLVNATSDHFWEPMTPRSLGSKRHRISDARITEISEIYNSMQPGEYSRVFDNTDFGYRRIRIDRPLRLNFQASPERISLVQEQPAFQALTKSKKKSPTAEEANQKAGVMQQQKILDAMRKLPLELIKDPAVYQYQLDQTLKPLKLKEPLRKAILNALTERDETALPVPGRKTPFEPDAELRDHENIPLNKRDSTEVGASVYDEDVPLKQDVFEYFAREVYPYADDAWLDLAYRDSHDNQVGVVGYEINFNRYFFKYTEPDKPEDIQKLIDAKELEINKLLKASK